ncbi:hypothetical protein K474DRAFT_1659242 [Panus rudis PR-1116 ss-1]|nr:hypothetical protein K474DRAFT_1659242 [Panus rudis PR-1116 ss-1]
MSSEMSSHPPSISPLGETTLVFDELAKSETHNVARRRIVNSTTPISKLPVEVLTEIFRYCADTAYGEYGKTTISNPGEARGDIHEEHSDAPNGEERVEGQNDIDLQPSQTTRIANAYRWICITHVCSQWRTIALSCPMLWADVIMTADLSWNKEILRRSGKILLDVHMDWDLVSPAMDADFAIRLGSLEMTLRELHRIKKLTLDVPRHTFDKISAIDCTEAPHLRALTLGNHLSTMARSMDDVPLVFHKLQLPRLERLDLIGYPLHHISLIIRPSIRELIIMRVPARAYASEVLDVLKCTPLLEKLELCDALEALNEEEVEEPEEIVSLPNLKALQLEDFGHSCADLLNRIRYPPSAEVFLTLEPIGDDDFSSTIIEAISSKLTGERNMGPSPTFQSLAIFRGSEPDEIQIQAYRMLIAPKVLWRDHNRPQFILRLSGYGYVRILAQAVQGLPFQHVRSLSVGPVEFSDFNYIPGHVWCEGFKNLAEVESLCVAGNAAWTLPDQLHPQYKSPPAPYKYTTIYRNDTVFRSLKSLMILETDFEQKPADFFLEDSDDEDDEDEDEHGHGHEEDLTHEDDDFATRLEEVLTRKYRVGCPLEKLSIHRAYNLTEKRTMEIGAAVGYISRGSRTPDCCGPNDSLAKVPSIWDDW